jgi:hypothetical protein
MITLYTKSESPLTSFLNLRNAVTEDAITYHEVVVPLAQETLRKCGNIFDMLAVGYPTVERFANDINGYIFDLEDIIESLDVLVKIHTQVMKSAQTR